MHAYGWFRRRRGVHAEGSTAQACVPEVRGDDGVDGSQAGVREALRASRRAVTVQKLYGGYPPLHHSQNVGRSFEHVHRDQCPWL
jgi:hypothetical protein